MSQGRVEHFSAVYWTNSISIKYL